MKINQDITAEEVMLIDEDGRSLGVVNLDQAFFLAYEKEVDLVMLNENTPPLS